MGNKIKSTSAVQGHAGQSTLADTESVVLTSQVEGDDYRIDIAMPSGATPAGGWPSIYLLDASGCFGTCVEAMRRMSRRPDATSVFPMAVIGVSSAAGGYDVPRRQRDFTTPPAEGSAGRPGTGGAATFLDFLDREVKPFVAGRLPLDPRKQTLAGHSLAGYFVLWTLLNRGESFRNYAAISPSVWWDRPGLFAAAERTAPNDRRVFVTIGEWEGELPPWQQAQPKSAEVAERRKARAMIANAREISERLAHTSGGGVDFSILPQEDHASIVSAAMPRILRFASLPD